MSSYLMPMQIFHRLLSCGLPVCVILMCTTVSAQLNYYTFSQSTSTYEEITGGTDLGTAGNDNLAFLDPEIPQGGQSNHCLLYTSRCV